MRIIVDAMGGDNAPQAPVQGALQAIKEYGVEVVLVGRGEEILEALQKEGVAELPQGLSITTRWWRCATILPPPLKRKRTPPSRWG